MGSHYVKLSLVGFEAILTVMNIFFDLNYSGTNWICHYNVI